MDEEEGRGCWLFAIGLRKGLYHNAIYTWSQSYLHMTMLSLRPPMYSFSIFDQFLLRIPYLT